ncbi:MAG: CRISPR-associated endonuclease Cas2 [Candidatus Anammoximicrobium sp.]|nr:CRISPR-associated endonuclease Cas2 [Candidatus Anammoximicrobium sp.]
MRYIVAYDIAAPRRLRRVARLLEKHALRCQKSVFLYDGSKEKLAALLDDIKALINEREDCVCAWGLAESQPKLGLTRGTSAYVYPASVVIAGGQKIFVDQGAA